MAQGGVTPATLLKRIQWLQGELERLQKSAVRNYETQIDGITLTVHLTLDPNSADGLCWDLSAKCESGQQVGLQQLRPSHLMALGLLAVTAQAWRDGHVARMPDEWPRSLPLAVLRRLGRTGPRGAIDDDIVEMVYNYVVENPRCSANQVEAALDLRGARAYSVLRRLARAGRVRCDHRRWIAS